MKMIKKAAGFLAVIFLLSGCSSKGFETSQVAEMYTNAKEISAQVDIRTNAGVVMDYTLSYTKDESSSSVEILSPESIAGIKASLQEGGARMVFDDLSVEMLLPSVSGFTPVDAMEGIVKDLAQSLPADYSFETKEGVECVAITYSGENSGYQAEKRVWLRQEDLAVVMAEFYLDGQMIMGLKTQSFRIYN